MKNNKQQLIELISSQIEEIEKEYGEIISFVEINKRSVSIKCRRAGEKNRFFRIKIESAPFFNLKLIENIEL